MGIAVSVVPIRVAHILKPKGGLPTGNWLRVWRVLGVILVVGSLVKLAEILGGAR